MSLQPSSHTRYRVLEKVGEGSFSQVFRAVDREDGQLVALKKVRLRDTRALPAGAIREALSLQQLAHPNVLPLHDLYTHGSSLILVLPFLPYSLAALLSGRDAPLPEAHARSFARMMLQGLAACHGQRLLHRDLKPGNLLVSARGVLQLADFGQARLLPAPGEACSLSHDVATRWYRSPEAAAAHARSLRMHVRVYTYDGTGTGLRSCCWVRGGTAPASICGRRGASWRSCTRWHRCCRGSRTWTSSSR